MTRWLAQPLVHFIVGGAVLFGAYRVMRPLPAHATAVVIDRSLTTRLTAEFSERNGRAPTASEAAQLVDQHISDELLVKEAMHLGLEQNDVIVRRRLLQKMRLLLAARQPLPTDAEIAAYIAAHADRFAATPRLDGTIDLLDGNGHAIGSPLGRRLAGVSEHELAARFDTHLAAAVFAQAAGATPVRHRAAVGEVAVVVARRYEAPLEPTTLRNTVVAELEDQRQATLVRNEVARLKTRYAVEQAE